MNRPALAQVLNVAAYAGGQLKEKKVCHAFWRRWAAAWVDEARLLLQAGDLESAAARLELAREAKPNDPTLLFRLAGLNFDLQRNDIAREYVQAAISISPATWQILQNSY